MSRKTIVWFGMKLYGLIGKLYGLERNCMVSNHESYGLGRVSGRQVCSSHLGHYSSVMLIEKAYL